jgi:uncharacterized protein DUF4410
MKTFYRRLTGCLLLPVIVIVLAGCASTKITQREQLVTGPIPRPNTIWVYDFAATAAEIPANSALAGANGVVAPPQTAAQIADGKKLGNQIATALVAQISAMGLPCQLASTATRLQINDITIRGYLLSVEPGSTAKRVAIGFGSGASSLSTMVEGFQMTARGLRKLGNGTVDAGGGKSPGMILGVATFIATKNPAGLIINAGVQTYGQASGSSTVEGRAKATAKVIGDALKQRFQQQGWIN